MVQIPELSPDQADPAALPSESGEAAPTGAELSQPGDIQPGQSQPGQMRPGQMRPGQMRPGQMAVGHAEVDSEAITEDAIRDAEPDAPLADVHGFAGGETDAEDPDSVASDGPIPPQWQSEQSQRTRQIVLVTLVSLAGLISALVVFGWFVRGYRQRSAMAETSSDPVVETPAETPGVEERSDANARGDSSSSPQPDDDSSTEETKSGLDENGSSQSSTEKAAGSESTGDSSTDGPTMIETPGSPTSPSPLESTPTSDSPSAPSDLIPSSPLDGPDASDAGSDPQADDSDDGTSPPTDGGGAMQELPPELAQYSVFLLDDGVEEEPTLQAPPTMDEVDIDAAAERENPNGTEVEALNTQAALGIRVALDAEGYPLADLMLLVSQITGAPIQIDWVSFDLAAIDLHEPVKTPRGWQTAGDLLNATAQTIGGEVREEESLLILTLADAAFEEHLNRLADLSDFRDADTAVATVNRFMGAPEDAKALVRGTTREEQQLTALAIEALRRMRGIEPKLDESHFQHWASSAQSPSTDWPLVRDGESGPQMDAPLALSSLLRRTGRRNGASVVVNWYDALRRGAAPTERLIPHAGHDAATMLEQVLRPYDLQLRRVDDHHWWMGTASTYDRLTTVVWTEPLGDQRPVFVKRLKSIMGDGSPEIFRMAIDEKTDRALLLLPRFIVRQLPKIAPAIAAK